MQLSLSELLQGKHESEFSSDELSAKAHSFIRKEDADEGDYYAAALLFEASARVADAEFRNDTSEPNYSLTGYCQAGIWFSRAGHFDEAKPLLEHSIEADWVGVGLRDDFHLARSCYLELLSEEAKTPSESMVALYEKARAHCEEMSWVFPNMGSAHELLANATTPLGRQKLAEEIETVVWYARRKDAPKKPGPPIVVPEKTGKLGPAQFDLRPYPKILHDWLDKMMDLFIAEHPDEVVSAMGVHFVMAANDPWFIFGFDTKENSDRHVARFPDWTGKDEYGEFGDNPADFAFYFTDYTFDEFPDIFELDYSELVLTAAGNDVLRFSLGNGDFEDPLTNVFVNFLISVLESYRGYRLLNREGVFRIVVSSEGGAKFWVAN